MDGMSGPGTEGARERSRRIVEATGDGDASDAVLLQAWKDDPEGVERAILSIPRPVDCLTTDPGRTRDAERHLFLPPSIPVQEDGGDVEREAFAWFLHGVPDDATVERVRSTAPGGVEAVRAWRDVLVAADGAGWFGEAVPKSSFVLDHQMDIHNAACLRNCVRAARDPSPVWGTSRVLEGLWRSRYDRRHAYAVEDAMVGTALIEAGCRPAFLLSRCGERGSDLEAVFVDGTLDVARGRARPRANELRNHDTPYWRSRSLVAALRRPMALCRTPEQVWTALVERAATGEPRCFVKAPEPKVCFVVDLRDVRDEEDAALALHRAVGRHLSCRGKWWGKCLLVQGFRAPTHEKRFWFLGVRLIAESPSDRSLTVLDAWTGDGDDPRVARLDAPADGAGAYDRGTQTTVVDRSMSDTMRATALDTVRATLDEYAGMPRRDTAWVLDVGWDGDGPFLVEVNGFPRAGTYGMDPRRYAEGVAEWTAKAPVHVRDEDATKKPLERLGHALETDGDVTWTRAHRSLPLADVRPRAVEGEAVERGVAGETGPGGA